MSCVRRTPSEQVKGQKGGGLGALLAAEEAPGPLDQRMLLGVRHPLFLPAVFILTSAGHAPCLGRNSFVIGLINGKN